MPALEQFARMVDRVDMTRIAENPVAAVDVLNREAQHAMQIEALEL